ncbi:aminoacyl-tRNA hydrolase [Candidatus Poribacteria bacterium]|nr:aminoacyl-tRNA hydrolase [Candidatus Poribacteria bacterium]
MNRTILIAGLGNPGKKYTFTRHNIGFLAIDAYAEKEKTDFTFNSCESLFTKLVVDETRIIIAKPQTFMNLSGKAIKELCFKFSITPKNIFIINDDINIPFGKLRLRQTGSHGGHNGLLSIIETLGTEDFSRLRVGVGAPTGEYDLKSYVLMNFSKEEMQALQKIIIPTTIDAIDHFIKFGITKTMNKFNAFKL